MLVLTRGANQSIVIDHDIVVTVLDVRGDHVRIGITAPDHIQIHRQEVFDAVQQAGRRATKARDDVAARQAVAPSKSAGRAGAGGGRARGDSPREGPPPVAGA